MEKINQINSKYGAIAERVAYLTATDYHVIKESETKNREVIGPELPYTIPDEVVYKRKQARDEINQLQSEIELLIDEINAEGSPDLIEQEQQLITLINELNGQHNQEG